MRSLLRPSRRSWSTKGEVADADAEVEVLSDAMIVVYRFLEFNAMIVIRLVESVADIHHHPNTCAARGPPFPARPQHRSGPGPFSPGVPGVARVERHGFLVAREAKHGGRCVCHKEVLVLWFHPISPAARGVREAGGGMRAGQSKEWSN